MKKAKINLNDGVMLLGGAAPGAKLSGAVSGMRDYIEARSPQDFIREIKARISAGDPVRLDVYEDECPAFNRAVDKLRSAGVAHGLGYQKHADANCDAAGFGRFVVTPPNFTFPKANDAAGKANLYYSQEEITRIFSSTYMDYRILMPEVEKLNAEIKKLSRYPGLAQAMASRYIMQLKGLNKVSLDMRTLTKLENDWLKLRVTVAGYREKDYGMIFLSAAEIARRMKLNRKFVNRMEDRLEKREDIKAVLREAGAPPRLARGAACPKRP